MAKDGNEKEFRDFSPYVSLPYPHSLFDFTKHYRSEVSGGILKISYYPQLNPEKWNDVLAARVEMEEKK